MVINAKEARKKLTYLWFIICGLLLLIFIIQHLNGKFENYTAEAWMWISPNIFPFIGLVSGGYIIDKNEKAEKYVDRFYYKLSFFSSLFYFTIILLVIVTYPLSEKPILEHYKDSNLFLIPIQSIITGIIGIFFIKGNEINENS
ncbi:MAG: hypothetical protein JWQ79_1933 [Mucilaginibacter sp.]|nr:hypothetical protein [Mucilaginibacter sp.]